LDGNVPAHAVTRAVFVGALLLAGSVSAVALAAPQVTDAAQRASDPAAAIQVSGLLAGQPESPGSNAGAADQVVEPPLPICPPGQLPVLHVARFPDGATHGAPTPEAAVAAIAPDQVGLKSLTFGRLPSAPVWFANEQHSFITTMLPDRSWFASPATFRGCRAPPTPRPAPRAVSPGPVG
jgi:hypothetical protein